MLIPNANLKVSIINQEKNLKFISAKATIVMLIWEVYFFVLSNKFVIVARHVNGKCNPTPPCDI